MNKILSLASWIILSLTLSMGLSCTASHDFALSAEKPLGDMKTLDSFLAQHLQLVKKPAAVKFNKVLKQKLNATTYRDTKRDSQVIVWQNKEGKVIALTGYCWSKSATEGPLSVVPVNYFFFEIWKASQKSYPKFVEKIRGKKFKKAYYIAESMSNGVKCRWYKEEISNRVYGQNVSLYLP